MVNLLPGVLPVLVPVGVIDDLLPAIAIVCVFGFVGVVASLGIWTEARRRERDALYRSELLKKIAENPASAEPVLAHMRAEDTRKQRRRRDALMLGGLICCATGVGVAMFMLSVTDTREHGAWMVGTIPILVGMAMLAHAKLVLEQPRA